MFKPGWEPKESKDSPVMNIEKVVSDRGRLQAALTEIERVGWREGGEGEDFKDRLIECRKIARDALETIGPD